MHQDDEDGEYDDGYEDDDTPEGFRLLIETPEGHLLDCLFYNEEGLIMVFQAVARSLEQEPSVVRLIKETKKELQEMGFEVYEEVVDDDDDDDVSDVPLV